MRTKKILLSGLFLFSTFALFSFENFKSKMYPSFFHNNNKLESVNDDFFIFEIKNDYIYIYEQDEKSYQNKENLPLDEIEPIAFLSNKQKYAPLCLYDPYDKNTILSFVYTYENGTISFNYPYDSNKFGVFTFNSKTKEFVNYKAFDNDILIMNIDKNNEKHCYEFSEYDNPDSSDSYRKLGYYTFDSRYVLDFDFKYINRIQYISNIPNITHYEFDENIKPKIAVLKSTDYTRLPEIPGDFWVEKISTIDINANKGRAMFLGISSEEYKYYDMNMTLRKTESWTSDANQIKNKVTTYYNEDGSVSKVISDSTK